MEPCFKLTFNAFIICRETSHLTLIFLGSIRSKEIYIRRVFGLWFGRVNLSWLIRSCEKGFIYGEMKVNFTGEVSVF